MKHRIVVSRYKRNGRAEVLVIRDAKDREVMHLHPDHNAVDAEVWDKVKGDDKIVALLASGQLVDKGDAPPEPAPEVEPEVEAPKAAGAPAPETTLAPEVVTPPAPAIEAEDKHPPMPPPPVWEKD